MTRTCRKKVAALTWAFLECMFFSSVVLGWTWLTIVLRNDGYFPEYCNLTQNQTTHGRMFQNLGSMDGVYKIDNEVPQSDSKKPKACRPAKRKDRSTSTRESSTMRDKIPWVRATVVEGVDVKYAAMPRWDSASVVRNVIVEPELDHIATRQSQQRFRRGHVTNLTAGMSLLQVSHRPAVAVAQSVSEDPEVGKEYSYLSREYCLVQNEQLRLLFAVVIILRDVLTFPLGIFFDKYGTTRTRLLTVLIFALGTLMMTFTSVSVPWLVVPALTLTGVAGSAVLLTNLQTANLFGRKRHVVVSMYVGAAYSNGVIALLMQLSHLKGVDIQTSFMFLTIGIVPMLVSTVAFLPKTRVPWPLPADYGKRRNQSLDEAMLRKQRAWQRRMSDDPETDLDPQLYPESSPLTDYDSTEAGVGFCRKPPPKFSPTAVQSLYVWSVLWFGIQKLQEAVFETRVVDIADLEVMGSLDFEEYFGYVQLMGAFCSPLVGVLIDRYFPRDLGYSQATRQMQRIVPAIVATSCLALAEIVTDMFHGPATRAISTLFNILHKVFTHSTMCAFVMHVHFNHQHLGKFYGLTCALSAIIAAFQFPVRTFLVKKYSSMLPAHVLLLILSIVSFAHAINAWNYCRKRLIRDQSDRSSERCIRTGPGQVPLSVHIETDDSNLPVNKFMGDQDAESGVYPRVDSAKMGIIEMTDIPATTDGRNGGSHVILELPRADTMTAYSHDDVDDDDEEAIIATALEFVKI